MQLCKVHIEFEVVTAGMSSADSRQLRKYTVIKPSHIIIAQWCVPRLQAGNVYDRTMWRGAIYLGHAEETRDLS